MQLAGIYLDELVCQKGSSACMFQKALLFIALTIKCLKLRKVRKLWESVFRGVQEFQYLKVGGWLRESSLKSE